MVGRDGRVHQSEALTHVLEHRSGGGAYVVEVREAGVVGGGVAPEVEAGGGEGAGDEAGGEEAGGGGEKKSSDDGGGVGRWGGWVVGF